MRPLWFRDAVLTGSPPRWGLPWPMRRLPRGPLAHLLCL